MTETELKNIDKHTPFKATQAGKNTTERFATLEQAMKHYRLADSTCLITSYVNNIFKIEAYKHLI